MRRLRRRPLTRAREPSGAGMKATDQKWNAPGLDARGLQSAGRGGPRCRRLVKLLQDEQLFEAHEFETTEPTPLGEMTISSTLIDAEGGGTVLVAAHEGAAERRCPRGRRDRLANGTPWLAALVEAHECFAALFAEH